MKVLETRPAVGAPQECYDPVRNHPAKRPRLEISAILLSEPENARLPHEWSMYAAGMSHQAETPSN